jgi:hypothetical protein
LSDFISLQRASIFNSNLNETIEKGVRSFLIGARGVKGKLLKKFSLKIPFKTSPCARRSGRVRASAPPLKEMFEGFSRKLFKVSLNRRRHLFGRRRRVEESFLSRGDDMPP